VKRSSLSRAFGLILAGILAAAVACGIIALMIAATRSAHAHGDAAWIMNNERTKHCCGPRDCEKAPPHAVVEQDGGWFIPDTGQMFTTSADNVYPSKDGDFWWCRSHEREGREPADGNVRCLFVPVET
jgi:hypothetical protein